MAGETFDYYAFISYSHNDKDIAQKLQKRLERYHMPAKLLEDHPELPKKIAPIFRDESDLVARDGTLSDSLKGYLKESNYLILICSPNSAHSIYVNAEVDYFINTLHREDRIIPLIVDGLPHSKDSDMECFPPAILALDREHEPLGIDLKTFGRREAFLRVIATLLRLKYTDFKPREEEERKRRAKIFGAVAAVFAMIAWYSFDLFYEVTYKDESLLSIANSYYYRMDYANAKKWFERAAVRGNSEAQCNLGKMYQNGEGVDKDYYKAMEWLGKAATSAGNRFEQRDADYAIAEIYIDVFGEEGVAKRDKEWHEKTFADGLPAVQCAVARMYYEGQGVDQNYAKAMEWYQKAAAKENSGAQYAIGDLYEEGNGVKQDYAKAMEWYLKAAAKENSNAQYAIGNLYEEGKGVKQDYAKAMEWYLKAAAKENDSAQCAIANMYEKGLGVERDYVKAKEWYEKAADNANHGAQEIVEIMDEIIILVKQADSGDIEAMNNIGDIYHEIEDYADAIAWYEKAAAFGNSDAQYNLGVIYEEGNGVKRNYAQARKWYEKAAAQGHSDAQYNLGTMYEEGNGVKRNYAKAKELYEKSAAQGEAEAQYRLGVMYRDGLGMPKDEKKAVEWFAKAAAQNHGDASRELKALSDY